MKRRNSKNAYRHIMKFVAPFPTESAHLWYARDYSGAGTTMRSRRGPDYSFSVAGPMYDDNGVSVGAIPVLHHDGAGNIRGVWGGPAYSNIFTNVTPTAETKSLTAQQYCLQVFGIGASATCSYGTATPGSPLIFTATAGSTTFTPTACAKWMLSAVGGFVFPYVPPGTSVVSAAGTTGGNGASLTLDERLLAAFRGKTDGVELYKAAGWSLYYATKTGDSFTINATVSNVAASLLDLVTPTIPSGSRCLIKYEIYDYVSGSVSVNLHDNDGGNTAGTARGAAGVYTEEMTLTCAFDSINIQARLGAGFVGKIRNISIQRLLPATCTVAALTCMGVGSGELASDSMGVISAKGDQFSLLYYSGSNTINKSYDGTISNYQTIAWNRDELHLRVVQTKTDGSQFRVGYRRYNLDKTPIDSAITWLAWVNFDGSFNPLTALRWFLNGTVPVWQRAVAIWDKGAIAESEIRKRMEAA